jgi:hypothetical protein
VLVRNSLSCFFLLGDITTTSLYLQVRPEATLLDYIVVPALRILTLWQNTLAYLTKAFNIMRVTVKCENLSKKSELVKYGTQATFYTTIMACFVLVRNRLLCFFHWETSLQHLYPNRLG